MPRSFGNMYLAPFVYLGAYLAAPTLAYPYPAQELRKSIQPDFYNADTLSQNGAEGIAANFVWANWEPQVKYPPCDTVTEYEYEGRCFVIRDDVDKAIQGYAAAGLAITGVLYGSPDWAWAWLGASCTETQPSSAYYMFCMPEDPADFARSETKGLFPATILPIDARTTLFT